MPELETACTCTKSKMRLSSEAAIKKFTSYVVLDFETTGLSPQSDAIIEYSIMKVENGQITGQITSFVNPERPIPAKITRITGITKSDVENAPTITDAIHQIKDYIGKLPIVAHNASFDVDFLIAAYEKMNISAKIRYVDTLALSRKAFPDAPDHKLSTLIEEFDLAESQTHRASDDVVCTQKLLELCLSEIASELDDSDQHEPCQSESAARIEELFREQRAKSNAFDNVFSLILLIIGLIFIVFGIILLIRSHPILAFISIVVGIVPLSVGLIIKHIKNS